MICEKCGCHDRVMRTETRAGRVIRLRRCHNCGFTVETEEKKLEDKLPRRRGRPPKRKKPDPPIEEPGNGMLAAASSGVE